MTVIMPSDRLIERNQIAGAIAVKDKLGNRQGQWAGRRFTAEQTLKRDIRSAATRSKKSGVKPTLPKIKSLDTEDKP